MRRYEARPSAQPRTALAWIAAATLAIACAAALVRAEPADSTHLRMPIVKARPGGAPVPIPPDTAVGPRGEEAPSGPSTRKLAVAARAVSDLSGHPRFAGTWKLSKARSRFGSIPGGTPNARTDVIEESLPHIVQTLYLLNGSRRDTTVYRYTTDGRPTVNTVDGRDIKSVVTWEGSTLHLVSTTKLLVFDMALDERWHLSADGKTLTMTRHVKYPLGQGDQTLVFERQ